jgi:hypothetical protein
MTDNKKIDGRALLDLAGNETEQLFRELADAGRIVDSGRRRWSERKQKWEIVWITREAAERQSTAAEGEAR